MLSRILFSLAGIPILFNPFFSVVDTLPYAETMDLIANGVAVEISVEQKAKIQTKLVDFLEESEQMPALAVTFPEMFEDMLKDGYYLSFKFDGIYEINGLSYDQVVFEVLEDCAGFNVFRGNNGIFQGRCFYVQTKKSSAELYQTVKDIVGNATTNDDNMINITSEI